MTPLKAPLRRINQAILFVESQPVHGGDIPLRGFTIYPVKWARSFSKEDKERAPVVEVRVEDLLAVQDSVDRAHMLTLLRYGWKNPILVTPHPRGLIMQDGHHRAYAAKLLGLPTIQARILPFPGDRPSSLRSSTT